MLNVIAIASICIFIALFIVVFEKIANSQRRYAYTPVVIYVARDEWGTLSHSKQYSQMEMDHHEYLNFHRNAERNGYTVETTWIK